MSIAARLAGMQKASLYKRSSAPTRRKVGGFRRRTGGFRRRFKRGRKNNATTKIMRSPTGFPDRIFVKLKYSDIKVATTTAGAASVQIWRANTVFDPDFTGVGHQPYATDQWGALYNKFRVHGSSIRCSSYETSGTIAWQEVILPHLATASPASIFPVEEMPYVSVKTQANNTSLNKQNMVKGRYMGTSKIFGVDKQTVRSEDNFAGNYGTSTDPANLWYWTHFIYPMDTSSTITVYVNYHLEFYVEWYQRKDLTHS